MCSCLGLDYGVHAGLQLKHGFRMRSLECVTRVTGDWGSWSDSCDRPVAEPSLKSYKKPLKPGELDSPPAPRWQEPEDKSALG